MNLTPLPVCAVLIKDNIRVSEAQRLANQLQLPLIDAVEKVSPDTQFILCYTSEYLALYDYHDTKCPAFYLDFLDKRFFYRLRAASLKKEMLARALGCHPHTSPHIVDGTAGLGRDAFLLARLGFHVTMIEQSPILSALLRDALRRASQHSIAGPITARLTLLEGDTCQLITDLKPDVIYLDPMFPAREKTAAVKKEMVMVQKLVGSAKATTQLLKMSLSCAAKRVVIKRPRLSPALDDHQPDFALIGKTSRFDVYLSHTSL